MTDDAAHATPPTTFLLRAIVGLLQGLAVFALVHAADAKSWPATEPMLYAPLLVVCIFVPLVAIVGLGNLRGRTLTLWTAAAIAVCAGLAIYDVYRDPGTPPRHGPHSILWLALAVLLALFTPVADPARR